MIERDRVGLAVDIARTVVDRPAELGQLLLDPAAFGGVDGGGGGVDKLAHHWLNLLIPGDLGEDRGVIRVENETVRRVLDQADAAVARHRLGDIDEQRLGDRKAGVALQHIHSLLRIEARRPRIPQRQRRDPVGVHVLRRALQLRERRQCCSRLAGLGVCNVEEDRLVRLHDERAVT